jgi:hypothetical protein
MLVLLRRPRWVEMGVRRRALVLVLVPGAEEMICLGMSGVKKIYSFVRRWLVGWLVGWRV